MAREPRRDFEIQWRAAQIIFGSISSGGHLMAGARYILIIIFLKCAYLQIRLLKNNFTCPFSVIIVDSSDEDFAHDDAWCRFSSRDLHDMEYILEHHFNKIMVAQYNSTTERWTGYTAWGVISAEKWNEDPDEIPRRRSDMDVLCKPYANRIYNTTEMFMGDYNNSLTTGSYPSLDLFYVYSICSAVLDNISHFLQLHDCVSTKHRPWSNTVGQL